MWSLRLTTWSPSKVFCSPQEKPRIDVFSHPSEFELECTQLRLCSRSYLESDSRRVVIQSLGFCSWIINIFFRNLHILHRYKVAHMQILSVSRLANNLQCKERNQEICPILWGLTGTPHKPLELWRRHSANFCVRVIPSIPPLEPSWNSRYICRKVDGLTCDNCHIDIFCDDHFTFKSNETYATLIGFNTRHCRELLGHYSFSG